MTTAGLQALLDAHDAAGCIALFASADEAERRKLAKTAGDQLKKVSAGIPGHLLSRLDIVPDAALQMAFPQVASHRGGIRAAQVAVLATAPVGALKKLGPRGLPPIDDAVAVISARRPPWLGEWVEAVLSWGSPTDPMFNLGARWRLVRRLVRAGLCPPPPTDRYINGMIEGMSMRRYAGTTLRAALVDDPGLLESEIWAIFETEPLPGRLAILPVDPGGPPEDRWELVLAKFAAEGRISRTRLLDASLSGLERDFHEARARWYALMHETLEPTADERAERSARYAGLAASHNPSTVSFALKALAILDRAGRAELAPVVDAIVPALLARAKGTVQAALALIDSAAQRDPAIRRRAAMVAVDALAHESPVVHQAVIDLILRHGDRTDRALAEQLASRLETVAASQRARLTAWLGTDAAPSESEPAASAIDGLRARAAALDPGVAAKAGVAAALAAWEGNGGEIPAIDFPEIAVGRLAPRRAIAPIAELDERIALFSARRENPANADDLERVLDGVSRLCDRLPIDFAARTGPLRARSERRGEMTSVLEEPLCGLALGWISGRQPDLHAASQYDTFLGLFARRILAIARRATARAAAPLLSAPTHLGGWIDPRVLVERAYAWESLPFRGDRLDGALALLRLAPDAGPRAEALRAAARLEGPYGAALRHALGGDGETVGPDARLWVAAARARAPRDDDPLVEARHPGLGPDAGRAARCSLRVGAYRSSDRWRPAKLSLIVCDPPLPTENPHDLPTVLLHEFRRPVWETIRWMGTVWPSGLESYFAAGCETLLGLECAPSLCRFFRPFLEPLLDPDLPLGPMGRLLLAGTLSSNQAELQGLAVDALIAAVDDGRLDGRLLGDALHRLLTDSLVKPARVAKALGDAARVSPLHARTVARAVQGALAGLAERPRDLHVLLELLKELLIETAERLSVPATEAFLRGLTVSGKTAKLSNDVLGLAGGSPEASRSAAIARALAGRLERAQRWSQVLTS